MEEGRNRTLGIMAAILAAQKLAQFDGAPKVPVTIMVIENAVTWADRITQSFSQTIRI
jgi:hypothetical protein